MTITTRVLLALSILASLAFAAPADAAPRKIAVILVEVELTGSGYTAASAERAVFGVANPSQFSTAKYYAAQTFGAVTFTGDTSDMWADDDGDGYEVTPAFPDGCQIQNEWAAAAENLAELDGFDQNDYDHVVYALNSNTRTCGYSATHGGKYVWIDGIAPYTLAHELGHNLGSDHANTLRCRSGGTPVAYSTTCDPSNEYGDPFDPMGNGGYQDLPGTGEYVPYHMSAWRKLSMGAIPASSAPVLTGPGRFFLNATELPSGTRLLRIPDGAGRFVDVSYRRPIGTFEGGADPGTSLPDGVMIHRDPRDFGANEPSNLLDMTPSTPTFDDAPLRPGKSFSYAPLKLTVTVESAGATSAVVKVDMPASGKPKPGTAPKRCTVPKLRGKKLGKARKMLKRNGCRLGKVKRKAARKAKRGRVIKQGIKPGAKRPLGKKVPVVVGRRP